jgi:hypothetical protein
MLDFRDVPDELLESGVAKRLASASQTEMTRRFAKLPPEAKALIYDIERHPQYERDQIMGEAWARGGLMAVIAVHLAARALGESRTLRDPDRPVWQR